MSNYETNPVTQMAQIFKALSNESRLRIFLRLMSLRKSETCCNGDAEFRACIGDLGKDLGVNPSTVSHHIKELRQAGLIRMQRCGQKVGCWVEPEVVESLTSLLQTFLPKGSVL